METPLSSAALTFLLCIATSSFAFGETLSIGTFNCEFLSKPKVHVKFGESLRLQGEAKAKWDAPGYRDQKFLEATNAVAEVVKEMTANIVVLTEVGDASDVALLQARLAAQGAKYPHVAVGKSRDPNRQYVAILSIFPLSDIQPEIIGRESFLEEQDDPETERDTGISKGMRVTVMALGKEIVLYAVHLASERMGSEQDEQRVAQASILRRSVLKPLGENKLVVVAGDLNDHRGQPALRRVRGLDDMYEDLIQTGFVKYFADDQMDSRWTYEYEGERYQIDHILLSYSFYDILYKRNGIRSWTVAPGNPLASDHRAFVVELRVK